MELTTVLLIVAAVVLLALVGTIIFLIVQKRSIEKFAVERADELVAESMKEEALPENVSAIRNDDIEAKIREAA